MSEQLSYVNRKIAYEKITRFLRGMNLGGGAQDLYAVLYVDQFSMLTSKKSFQTSADPRNKPNPTNCYVQTKNRKQHSCSDSDTMFSFKSGPTLPFEWLTMKQGCFSTTGT